MHLETLDILRCPYCGGRLELVTSSYHHRDDRYIHDGILGCHCCVFPVVAGIPVLHLLPGASTAREQIEAGRPDRALRTMFNLDDEQQAARFEAIASSKTATYRDLIEALGPNIESGYFLYRFSDPTYVIANAVVQAVAGAILGDGGRAIDICGGSGHLTRSLLELSSSPPVLTDLYFAKIWLARRFTAPGCEPVCCDGNAPLPFARGAFRYAMCCDAFHYIWTKRQFVSEMVRLIGEDDAGAVVINHTHSQRTWSPSHGEPLPPEGYRDLFETLEPRLFGEAGLLADLVQGESINLARRDSDETLEADPALTIVASMHRAVFGLHRVATPPAEARGEFHVNPLYAIEADADPVRLRLRFPSDEYEEEYGACRQYLPAEIAIERASLTALQSGRLPSDLRDLVRQRVIVDLPKNYY